MSSNLAVVGGGYWGKNLIRNFYELGALSFICDKNDVLKEFYAEKYPQVRFCTTFESVLNNESIDGVVLATPAAQHYAMAKQAFEHGKDVFVEKPLALSLAEAKELIALAEEQSQVLMVGHILQYHNAVLKLKSLIENGELGKLQYIYSNRLNIGKIRSEENILWSFAPHDISVILMLLGEMPKRLTTSGGHYLQEKVADTTITSMTFESGVKAHIFVSWLHPFKEQKLVVVGDKKMAVFNDTVEDKLVLYPHTVEWRDRIPVAAKADAEIVPVTMSEPLKAECEHFLSCIENRTIPKTDGHEGLRVLKVLTASQQSLDNEGSGVDLNRERGLTGTRGQKNEPCFFVHESSFIDDDVSIGDGTRIWHFSHVLRGSRIGEKCSFGQNVVVGPNVTIGKGCKVQNNVSIFEGLTLEDYVFCGPSMVFTNVLNPRAEIGRMDEMRHTLIKTGASLGANCTIVCGHTIGRYSFVGAGAVVTKDVPDYGLVLGNPAVLHGWMCRCGITLTFENDEAVCGVCGMRYRRHADDKIECMGAS